MTATLPPDTDLRDCRLYRFWVEHPVTGEEVLGYIGETVRQPFERMMEHVDLQSWIDTVTRWEKDPRVFAGKRAVLDAEAAAIRAERPLYNVKGNERNRKRIPPPLAIKQRRARDAERRRPRWVHPDDRAPAGVRQPARAVRERPRAVARKWRPWQKRLVGWSSAWLVLTGVAFYLLAHYDAFAAVGDNLIAAAVSGSTLIVWVMRGARIPVGKWKRRARKVRRWWW